MNITLIRSGEDKMSKYPFGWAGRIKNLVLTRTSYSLRECVCHSDSREDVEVVLNDPDIKLVIVYGHGEDDKLYCGRRENDVVLDLINVNLLKNKIVYTVACFSANRLGVEAVRKGGAQGFFGYCDFFAYLIDDSEIYFQECANIGIIKFLDDPKLNCGQIQDLIEQEYKKWISYYLFGAGASSPNSWATLIWLNNNLNAATFIGDRTATLS